MHVGSSEKIHYIFVLVEKKVGSISTDLNAQKMMKEAKVLNKEHIIYIE